MAGASESSCTTPTLSSSPSQPQALILPSVDLTPDTNSVSSPGQPQVCPSSAPAPGSFPSSLSQCHSLKRISPPTLVWLSFVGQTSDHAAALSAAPMVSGTSHCPAQATLQELRLRHPLLRLLPELCVPPALGRSWSFLSQVPPQVPLQV